jgi:hypothetical protein
MGKKINIKKYKKLINLINKITKRKKYKTKKKQERRKKERKKWRERKEEGRKEEERKRLTLVLRHVDEKNKVKKIKCCVCLLCVVLFCPLFMVVCEEKHKNETGFV